VHRLPPELSGTAQCGQPRYCAAGRVVRCFEPGKGCGVTGTTAQSAPPPCVQESRWARLCEQADLLRRVFAIEVLACACRGLRRVVNDARVARKIPDHLGLSRYELSTIPFRLVLAGKRVATRRS
jgi:hypothetical protein